MNVTKPQRFIIVTWMLIIIKKLFAVGTRRLYQRKTYRKRRHGIRVL